MRIQMNLLSFAASWLISFSAAATTIEFTATDTGWHSARGRHDPDNTNYAVGWSFTSAAEPETRNFFAFDLAALSSVQPIVSAELHLWMPRTGYLSTDVSELYRLYSVETDSTILVSSGTIGSTAVFDDLGTGSIFGELMTFKPPDRIQGTVISIALNQSAIQAINDSAGGNFAIGGAIETLRRDRDLEVLFSNSGPDQFRIEPTLVLVIPEPSSLQLLFVGLAWFGTHRRGRCLTTRCS
jgi:hypothetical protein